MSDINTEYRVSGVYDAGTYWTRTDAELAAGDQGTIIELSSATVVALANEAGDHGDTETVALCDDALAGSGQALDACYRIMLDAAMEAEA